MKVWSLGCKAPTSPPGMPGVVLPPPEVSLRKWRWGSLGTVACPSWLGPRLWSSPGTCAAWYDWPCSLPCFGCLDSMWWALSHSGGDFRKALPKTSLSSSAKKVVGRGPSTELGMPTTLILTGRLQDLRTLTLANNLGKHNFLSVVWHCGLSVVQFECGPIRALKWKL